MANRKTKSVVDEVATADVVATPIATEVKEKVKEEVKVRPLRDEDEIEVISLVPNVSYKDSVTNDMYRWDEIDHPEYMTFATIKVMWRNHKGYFNNLLLKPNDERVIEKLGIKKLYAKYDFILDSKNYTSKNVNEICDIISKSDNGLKFSIYNKIRIMIENEELTDISVIKKLSNKLKVDFIEFIK